ncbi:MAG: ABC transporter ATP-binding protein [Deltaproteobacteria bacterium]|jgi:branched-chain amino acid transport system ATP-binding protein|nr:ABC transporter ATP-binding protein [Deltaproteobacteria bacterium]
MLSATDLQVAYGPVVAVNNVSFRVPAGSIVSLIGPNGAGKTTILNALSGLAPLRSGSILFNGKDISRMSAHRRVSEGIAQVPEGRQVLAGMSVRENLELGGYRRPAKEVNEDIGKMEEYFPVLRQRSKAAAGSLSGGEQQMLAIARGLMARPGLLLLDEPSLGLAPLVVRFIFEFIQRLRDEGQTILLVEQNAREALDVSSYAYVIESGRIVIEGRAEQLRSDPAIARAYLGLT